MLFVLFCLFLTFCMIPGLFYLAVAVVVVGLLVIYFGGMYADYKRGGTTMKHHFWCKWFKR